MHVLFVAGWYPSRAHPTLGNFIQRHAAAVAQLHEVTVLHAAPDPTVQRTGTVSAQRDGVTEHLAYYNPGSIPVKAKWAAWRELLNVHGKDADIVHGHVLHAAVLPLWMLRRGAGSAPVITEHWTGYQDGRADRLPFPVRWMMRQLAARAACLCPVSDNLGHAMQKAGLRGRYRTVQNVVDTSLFHPRPRAPRTKPFRFLHVSTLMDGQKNITGLLEAFHRAWKEEPGLALDLISDGDAGPFQTLAAQLGLPSTAITFTGTSPLEHIAERMAASDALVLFSRRENMPCVIAEAFASGIPVIATDVGGISEHLTPERGILLQNGDGPALQSAFLRMARAPDSFQGRALRTYAEQHFSMARVARDFDAVYQQALAHG